MTPSRIHLSGSTSGLPIIVVAVATPGTTIHTSVAGASSFDEIYLWVANVTAAIALLTLQWGGVTDPGNHLVKSLSIPAFSMPYPIAVGQNMNGALVVKAFSDTASALNITGFCNRLIP